ncbi:MAG TPA: alanine/glycine:cation symporter family protein [Sphingomonadales bacterium]|nr:alanine/glycine:cation symporter family protein [Sphingomonadales bacterium]
MVLDLAKLQKWMRLLWGLFALFLAGLLAYGFLSQETAGKGVDEVVGGALAPLGEWLSSKVFYKIPIGDTRVEAIVLWMLCPMLFFTVWFGFLNLRGLRHAYHVISGRFLDPKAPGDVSQFQALTTALSGTVGLGNIAGVAIAVGIGGPGAAFWMLMIGLFAMALKFAECTMAVKYRVFNRDGSVSGGPMYYLYHGLKARGLSTLGAVLAVAYAVLTLPAITQIGQVNQSFSQIKAVTGFDQGLLYGFLVAGLTGMVIMGGIRGIAKVTSRLVPLMGVIYLGAGFIILFVHAGELPYAVALIVERAFAPEAVQGGFIGALVVGMRRAIYSTEAGLGSSTIAHAAAKTREPVSEGYVGLTEPFLDTLVGLMTALIIVATGAWQFRELGDIQITSLAFASVIPWFPWVLALAAFLFAFSTIISWYYYIEKVWTFLFGDSQVSVVSYKAAYCLLLAPGAVLSIGNVINIMDSLFFLLAVPNIIGLYIMAGELRRDLKDYQARLKTGKIKMSHAKGWGR